MNIKIDADNLNEAVLDIVDSLTVHNLKRTRESVIIDYEAANDGRSIGVFSLDNNEVEAFELSRRIEALDLILDWFDGDHQPYDFGV